jgi:hypothetical protein
MTDDEHCSVTKDCAPEGHAKPFASRLHFKRHVDLLRVENTCRGTPPCDERHTRIVGVHMFPSRYTSNLRAYLGSPNANLY